MVHNGVMAVRAGWWRFVLAAAGAVLLGAMAWLVLRRGTTLGNEVASIVSMLIAAGTALAVLYRQAVPARAELDLSAHLRFTTAGRAPLAGALDPVELGVKQPLDTARFGLTGYVGRDQDAVLVDLASAGGMLVLHGPATAGKTRAAAELLRTPLLAGRTLLVPSHQGALRALLDGGFRPRDAVVWLDDLERFLGSSGLDEALLERLCPHGRSDVAVIATIREDELTGLLDAESGSGHDRAAGAERPGARLAHQLKQAGRLVRLGKQLSPAERDRAVTVQARAQRGDTRISTAVASGTGFGEHLIAGPAMMDHWAAGDTPEAHLSRAAISAAIDCRRAGYDQPIPAATLHALAPGYLPVALRRADLPSIGQALGHACRPLAGTPTSSCLTPLPDATYSAADYLLDRSAEPPSPLAGVPIADAVWPAVIGIADRYHLGRIGFIANNTGNPAVAETAWRKAAGAGDIYSINRLSFFLEKRGDLAEAEQWLRKAAGAGDTFANTSLGLLLERLERKDEAEQCLLESAGRGDAFAMTRLGRLLERQNRLGEAERWLREGAGSGDAYGESSLGQFLAKQGRHLGDQGLLTEAEEWLRKAAGAGNTYAKTSLGQLVRDQGRAGEAEQYFLESADTGYTYAMLNLGRLLDSQGRVAEAEHWLRRAAASGDPYDEVTLGRFLEKQGRQLDDGGLLAEAEEWLRKAAGSGDTYAMARLAVMLRDDDRLDEAERWFLEAAGLGDVYAMTNLGRLLDRQGRLEEAERWLLEGAATGNIYAQSNLGRLLERQGRLAEAEEWLRKAASTSDGFATYWLGSLLSDQARTAEAEPWFRKSAEAGNSHGANALGRLLHRQGRASEAEAYFRQAAGQGNSGAMLNLSDLLAGQGKKRESEHWLREAAGAGNAVAAKLLRRLHEGREDAE